MGYKYLRKWGAKFLLCVLYYCINKSYNMYCNIPIIVNSIKVSYDYEDILHELRFDVGNFIGDKVFIKPTRENPLIHY